LAEWGDLDDWRRFGALTTIPCMENHPHAAHQSHESALAFIAISGEERVTVTKPTKKFPGITLWSNVSFDN
jgi:hypothetical protein